MWTRCYILRFLPQHYLTCQILAKILYPTIGEGLNIYNITIQLKIRKFKNYFYEVFNDIRNASDMMLIEKIGL